MTFFALFIHGQDEMRQFTIFFVPKDGISIDDKAYFLEYCANEYVNDLTQ